MSVGDPVDRVGLRRNVRWLVGLILGLAMVGLGVGVGIAAATGDRHPDWPVLVGFLVGVLVVMTVVLLVTVRLMGRRSAWSQVMQYGWGERRAAYKAVKAGRPLDQRQVAVARAGMTYLQRSGWTMWLWLVLIVVWGFNGLTHDGPLRWLWFGLAVGYLALLPFAVWQRRRVIERYRRALGG